MIQFAKSYQDSTGKCWGTLEEAQVAEVRELFKDEALECGTIVAKKDELLAILTITESSRPKARGQKRPRKPKVATEQQAA